MPFCPFGWVSQKEVSLWFKRETTENGIKIISRPNLVVTAILVVLVYPTQVVHFVWGREFRQNFLNFAKCQDPQKSPFSFSTMAEAHLLSGAQPN